MSLKGQSLVFEQFMDTELFKQLRAFVATLPINQPTPVFHIPTGQNVHDTSVRNSCSVTLDSPSVLDMIETCFVNRFEHPLIVKMARSTVTFIRYEKGGFFDWHMDHEKYTINSGQRWRECHALLCLDQPTEGGELEIDDKQIVLKENMCVLFDKSLLHRGAIVKDGVKVIMTLDVLVSTTDAQEYDYLGVEATDCINSGITFMTPFNSNDIISDFPEDCILFEYLEIVDAHKLHRYIIDCDGVYVHNNYKNIKKEEPRDKRRWRSYDNDDGTGTGTIALIEDAFSCSEVMLVVDNLERVDFGPYHRSIPRELDTNKIFSEIVVVDDDDETYELAYTYHCNETNYNKVEVRHYVGMLVLPDDNSAAEVVHEDADDAAEDASALAEDAANADAGAPEDSLQAQYREEDRIRGLKLPLPISESVSESENFKISLDTTVTLPKYW